jgi:hypothetical protein
MRVHEQISMSDKEISVLKVRNFYQKKKYAERRISSGQALLLSKVNPIGYNWLLMP